MRSDKRKQHLIDRLIQGRLIVALVFVELVLFLCVIGFSYWQLNGTIETQMFRVHGVTPDSQPLMYAILLKSVPWILLVNTLLILGIDHWWGQYVKGLVKHVRSFSEKV